MQENDQPADDQDSPDPFAETRAKIREFMTKHGIPVEHQDVFEPYLMNAVSKVSGIDIKLELEKHAGLVAAIGACLVIFGSYGLWWGLKAVKARKANLEDEKKLHSV